jgi:hypothetical protein
LKHHLIIRRKFVTPARLFKLDELAGRHRLSQEVNYNERSRERVPAALRPIVSLRDETTPSARNLPLTVDTVLIGEQANLILTLRGGYRGDLIRTQRRPT